MNDDKARCRTPIPVPRAKEKGKIMALSGITFTPEEMQEMEEAADESLRRKQHERAVQPPKGTQLAALKLLMERGRPDTVAAIAGISIEQLRSIAE
jgi:hypothetical protein